MRKMMTLGIFGLLALGMVGSVAAQDPPARRNGGHVIEIPEIHIGGAVQLPVEFVIVRSDTGYRLVQQRTSFVRDIVRSTTGDSFK